MILEAHVAVGIVELRAEGRQGHVIWVVVIILGHPHVVHWLGWGIHVLHELLLLGHVTVRAVHWEHHRLVVLLDEDAAIVWVVGVVRAVEDLVVRIRLIHLSLISLFEFITVLFQIFLTAFS